MMRVFASVLALLAVAAHLGLGQVRSRLAGPFHAVIGAPPSDLGARTVHIESRPGRNLTAWYAPGQPGRGVVVLVHGVDANRKAMLGRAEFLHRSGLAVVMPDLGSHGESDGDHVTFGADESGDVAAAIRFARAQAPGERVGLVGVSLGGAAALLGERPVDVDALVLESVFPTFDAAMRNRLSAWLGAPGPLLMKPLMAYSRSSLGIEPAQLRPVDAIARVKSPVLVVSGTADPYTPLPEARSLFDHATAPKAFWPVSGAGHEDLHAFAPHDYEREVGGFLIASLRA